MANGHNYLPTATFRSTARWRSTVEQVSLLTVNHVFVTAIFLCLISTFFIFQVPWLFIMFIIRSQTGFCKGKANSFMVSHRSSSTIKVNTLVIWIYIILYPINLTKERIPLTARSQSLQCNEALCDYPLINTSLIMTFLQELKKNQ